jgi:hypothetical protein
MYSGTPLIRINWDGESSGYAEYPDNWGVSLKTGSLKFGCYCLRYVPASKPFDHDWFEALEAIILLYVIR